MNGEDLRSHAAFREIHEEDLIEPAFTDEFGWQRRYVIGGRDDKDLRLALCHPGQECAEHALSRAGLTAAAGDTVAAGDMLGPDQPIILQLLEITPALGALEGVTMELKDAAFPLLQGIVETSGIRRGPEGITCARPAGGRDDLAADSVVSMNVWVMDTSAWVTGCLVWAAAAAIGALPRPDSLENTPRATPMRMPIITLAPKNPPEAAVGVKACLTTRASAAGMPAMLSTRMTKAPAM